MSYYLPVTQAQELSYELVLITPKIHRHHFFFELSQMLSRTEYSWRPPGYQQKHSTHDHPLKIPTSTQHPPPNPTQSRNWAVSHTALIQFPTLNSPLP